MYFLPSIPACHANSPATMKTSLTARVQIVGLCGLSPTVALKIFWSSGATFLSICSTTPSQQHEAGRRIFCLVAGVSSFYLLASSNYFLSLHFQSLPILKSFWSPPAIVSSIPEDTEVLRKATLHKAGNALTDPRPNIHTHLSHPNLACGSPYLLCLYSQASKLERRDVIEKPSASKWWQQ